MAEPADHKKAPLLVLASELLFHILYFVDVKDLMSLRKTCRALHHLSKERIVWINAVRGLCEDYGACSHTFPVDEMSLKELEHTATMDYRFTRRLWNELCDDEDNLEPEATRILTLSRKNNNGHSPGDLNGLILLSGGRFLLTSTDLGMIQLWDLGHSPNSVIHKSPLVCITPLQNRRLLCAQNTPNSQDIFVLTLSQSQSSGNYILELHRLTLSSNPPSFSLAASLEIKPLSEGESIDLISDTQFSLFSDHVLHWRGEVVVVWDFAQCRVAQWRNAESFTSPVDLLILDENVIVFQPPDVMIFDLPASQPYIAGDVIAMTLPNSPIRVPLIRLSYPGTVDYGFSMEPSWGRTSRFFDAIADNAPIHPGVSISRYFLRSVPQPSGTTDELPPLPRVLPLLVESTITDPSMPETASYHSSTLCDGSRLLISSTQSQIRAFLTRQVNSDNADDPKHLSGLLHDWFDLEAESCYGFCPMSGRLCVVSTEREIRVMDYVPLPLNIRVPY